MAKKQRYQVSLLDIGKKVYEKQMAAYAADKDWSEKPITKRQEEAAKKAQDKRDAARAKKGLKPVTRIGSMSGGFRGGMSGGGMNWQTK